MLRSGKNSPAGFQVDFLAVLLLFLVAVFFRMHGKSNAFFLVAGADGPYYPVQVKSILEKGMLAFPDMPLVFWLSAGLAKFLSWLSISEPVLTAVCLVDGLLPSLAIFPAWLMTRSILKSEEGEEKKIIAFFPALIPVAFCALNHSSLIVFSSQLEKNAIAVAPLFAALLYLFHWYVSGMQKADARLAAFWLFICGITHFGSFCIISFFLLILYAVHWIRDRSSGLNKFNQTHAFLLLGMFSVLIIFFFLDRERFMRLVFFPFRVFERPSILVWLDLGNKAIPGFGPKLLSLFVLLLLGVFLFQTRNEFGRRKWQFGLSLWLLGMALTSPLNGIEWANRLAYMVFVPIIGLLGFVFSIKNSLVWKWFIGSIVVLFMAINLMQQFSTPLQTAISPEALGEFQQIGNKYPINSQDLIVSRQDLRILGAWMYGASTSAEYLISKNDFDQHRRLLFITQKAGSNLAPARFREVNVPANSEHVFNGSYFDVFRIQKSGFVAGAGSPPRAFGKIVKISPNSIVVKNEISGNSIQVCYGSGTKIMLEGNSARLSVGQQAEVWGRWEVFGIGIDANEIHLYPSNKKL
jgi:hypothetical protein